MPFDPESVNKFVEERYKTAIDYYWMSSRQNKRVYKLTRCFTLILGSVVTVVTSLSALEQIRDDAFWKWVFAIGSPVLAAMLTVLGGFSQSFQWGAAWQDMVMTAQRLEKERDRFLITKPEERDLPGEVKVLNDFIINESQGFFQRILGGGKTETEKEE